MQETVSTMILPSYPVNRAIVLKNKSCPYCGVELSENTTKEHVIGRNFVPKGVLDANWNLIVRACKKCNSEKGDLEDEISAITMQPDAFGHYASNDPRLVENARRKAARSRSRTTKQPVGESRSDVQLSTPFFGGTMRVNFIGPPQLDFDRGYALARMQLAALFYLCTYDEVECRGYWWLGEYLPLDFARKSDWGNPIQQAFMTAVKEWEPRFIFSGSEEYFQAIIRRHPNAECWSWALEWNKSHRLLGFFGNHHVAKSIVDAFPAISMIAGNTKDGPFRFRFEIPLAEEDDHMFYWPL